MWISYTFKDKILMVKQYDLSYFSILTITINSKIILLRGFVFCEGGV